MTSAVCTEADDGGDTTAAVMATPAGTGEVYYFLVRTQNRCGISTAGAVSEDVLRSVRPCP